MGHQVSECALQPSFSSAQLHFSRFIVFALEPQDTKKQPKVHSVAPKTLEKLTEVSNRSELVLCVADSILVDIVVSHLVHTLGFLWFLFCFSVILKNIVCVLSI